MTTHDRKRHMTTMRRVTKVLTDAADVLAELDEEMIDTALERGEAPDHLDEPMRCDHCDHEWHGLRCHHPTVYSAGYYYVGDESLDDASLLLTEIDDTWPCRCDTSTGRLDDTWRPVLNAGELEGWMDRTGLDGWAARADQRIKLREAQEYSKELRGRYHFSVYAEQARALSRALTVEPVVLPPLAVGEAAGSRFTWTYTDPAATESEGSRTTGPAHVLDVGFTRDGPDSVHIAPAGQDPPDREGGWVPLGTVNGYTTFRAREVADDASA